MLPFRRIDDPFIRDMDKPSCIECIHYKPDYGTSMLDQCTQFGGKDLHTSDLLYDYADSVRRDESKCGKVGKYFKRDPIPFKIRRLFPVIAILGLLFSIHV